MIVHHFLRWVRKAPAGERAEAAGALARAYLYSDLSTDDRSAAEAAMIMLLDDASPEVRRALATALAVSHEAPPAVIRGLAIDQPDIASIVLAGSPLLIDAELVDIVAAGQPAVQSAVAHRRLLQRAVAAAIAEVGSAEACLVLVENATADIASISIERIADRFGHLAAVREALFGRDDLPAATRQALVSKLSATLADFVAARAWLEINRARRVAKEACEKATVTLAARFRETDMVSLVRHLRATGQLTAGLILRALLSGNALLFEQALAELSGLSLGRVRGLVYDKNGAGLRAVFDKAGLPVSTYPAFRAAISALHEITELGSASRLKTRMIERVLTGCEKAQISEIEPLLVLLRRFAAEAAQEEARLYCEELVDEHDAGFPMTARAAA